MNRLTVLIVFFVVLSMGFPGLVKAQTVPPSSIERLPLIRLYNPTINDHFYTSSRTEADTAKSIYGYRLEGEMGYVERYQVNGTEPIYRLWNPISAKHFYTTSSKEVEAAQKSGFTLEGNVGFMLANDSNKSLWVGTVIVYRLYNAIQKKHFYTTDQTEVEFVKSNGYISEGQLGGAIYNSQYNVQPL